jgi:hypothetical protein
MGGYLWLLALGGFGFLTDPHSPLVSDADMPSQLRYTAILLAINALWAGALVRTHIGHTPPRTRVWVYGLAAAASLIAAVALVVKYGSEIF